MLCFFYIKFEIDYNRNIGEMNINFHNEMSDIKKVNFTHTKRKKIAKRCQDAKNNINVFLTEYLKLIMLQVQVK